MLINRKQAPEEEMPDSILCCQPESLKKYEAKHQLYAAFW